MFVVPAYVPPFLPPRYPPLNGRNIDGAGAVGMPARLQFHHDYQMSLSCSHSGLPVVPQFLSKVVPHGKPLGKCGLNDVEWEF